MASASGLSQCDDTCFAVACVIASNWRGLWSYGWKVYCPQPHDYRRVRRLRGQLSNQRKECTTPLAHVRSTMPSQKLCKQLCSSNIRRSIYNGNLQRHYSTPITKQYQNILVTSPKPGVGLGTIVQVCILEFLVDSIAIA